MKALIFMLGLGFIGLAMTWGAFHYVGLQNILAALSAFPAWGIIPLTFFVVLYMAIGAWRWKRILSHQGMKISFFSVLGMWLAGFALGYVTPISYLGGEPLRAIMLKEGHGIALRKGFSSIFIDKIAEATVWIIMIAVAAFLFVLRTGLPDMTRTIVAGFVLFCIASGVIALVYLMSFQRARVMKRILALVRMENSVHGIALQEVESDVIRFFQIRNLVLWEVLFLSVCKNALEWMRNIFILAALGKGTQVAVGFIAFLFFSVSNSMPLPGALGVQEITQGLSFNWLGLRPETGIVFSLIVRFFDFSLMALGFVVLAKHGVNLLVSHIIHMVFPIKEE